MKKTPKQKVLKRYPKAVATSRIKGTWRVYIDYRLKTAIGLGDTASQAWADAAMFVRRYGG